MKKLLSIILSLLLIFSLSACGEKAPESTETNTNKQQSEKKSEPWYTKGEIIVTQEQVQKIVNSEFKTPKNIIVIIGDGMGPNDIILTEKYADDTYDFGLVVNQIVNHGFATTYSASSDVTDSAASGTALSTGTKTKNGYIGKDIKRNDLKTMAETAREAGKKVGIITDEVISGATPTAFTVHNISRSNTEELVNSMIKFKPDVLMGKDYSSVANHLEEEERKIFENEYLVAKDFTKFNEVLDTDPKCKKPFLGFLDGYSTASSYNLAQCAEVAFKRLQNENGFFVMIESAGTDAYGHANNIDGKLSSVVTLDRTVAAALLFMEKNPDTLLIVTSDHETGGVQLPAENSNDISNLFTSTYHTSTRVRVFAVGKDTEYFKGKVVDNTDIAKFVIKAVKGE